MWKHLQHALCSSTVVSSAAWYMIVIVLASMTGVSSVTVALKPAPPSHTC